MSAIAHRYEFVYLFDVANGNLTVTPTPATCRAWTRRPIAAW